MLSSLVTVIFGCRHGRLTFPQTRTGVRQSSSGTFVTCLDCGQEFAYDWQNMRVGEALRSRPSAHQVHQVDQCARSVVVRSVRRA